MTLEDYETRKTIINPFICLWEPTRQHATSLNTETLGEDGQRDLIHPLNEELYYQIREKGIKLYEVTAVIGKQNYPLVHDDMAMATGRTVRANAIVDYLASIRLGFLPESVVRERFPKSMQYFQEIAKKL